jgi:CBS-domain-containing membrane protein
MWSYVHFALAALAGLSAGYVMLLSNSWLQSVLGLTGLDFGQVGMLYVGGLMPGARVVGILFHLIDSVLLGALYALAFYPVVKGFGMLGGPLVAGVVGGIVYGVLVWLILAMLIAMPLVGLGIFGRKTHSVTPALLALALHVVYGLIVGFVYLP